MKEIGKRPDVVVLTGDKLRHRYFAARILESFDSALLVIERQKPEPWGAHVADPEPEVRTHFEAFHVAEKRFFEKAAADAAPLLASRMVLELEEGGINDREVIDRLRSLDPRVFAVMSTSILSPEFIDAFPRRLINYHAGLSPWYRGSGTNVFPFLNGELQYVGVTIHYIDPGIDSGDLIVQGRPDFEADDDSHTIGCKVVRTGTSLMIDTLRAYLEKGPPAGKQQDLSQGRLYKKKDFNADAVRKLRARIDAGVVRDYASSPPVPIPMISGIRHA